ncbi:MAG: hypothetical protein K2X48_12675 [Chitinophagaceae bacterium]|nr:hypothetical protein [Chitinophagaceae bacterium]
MKQLILSFLMLLTAGQIMSQGLAVNNSGAAADGSAMLDVNSTTKGALVPRMLLAQRTAIATPATGLLVYQTDGLAGFYYNAGTPVTPNWIRLSAENYWTLNGTNIYNNNTGNVGVGLTSPSNPFHVKSTTRSDIATFDGANQMYITLSENGSPKGYIGSFNQSVTADDVDFGTYAGTTGALHLITQATPRLTVLNSGNVGIGTTTPTTSLSVSGAANIDAGDANTGTVANALTFGNGSGEGIGSQRSFGGNQYGLDFYTASANRMSITNGGNVGIGTATPNAPLQFASDTRNRKIVLFEVGNNDNEFYGFGVNGGVLRYQAGTGVDNHVFYAGTSATTSSELMRITGAGNVGIGGIVPNFRLDVNGRMRIRDGGGGTAGLWLNNLANTASPAFIGMENDNSVGLFGNSGSGWSFTMNTTTGKVKIADGSQGNGRVLTSDAAGTATWTQFNSTQSVRTGSFGSTGANFDYSEMGSFPNAGTSKYTTVQITLPPGRWVVFANLLINGTSLPAGGGIFIRTYLAESATVATGTTDIVAGTGGLISGNFSYSNTFSFASGQILVNNTSGANKTYFLWANGSRNTSAPSSGAAVGALGSSFWGENQLFAIPMN